MSNESQRPQRRQADTGRVPQRSRVQHESRGERIDSNRDSQRSRVTSNSNTQLHVLERKAKKYKVLVILLVVMYILTVLIGVGLFFKGTSEVGRYKKELESVKSDYESKISSYESELADSRAYSSKLSDKLEEIGEIDVEGYESQISSLKKKNKKYEKKIKSYKEKINSYKSKIEEQQAVIDAIPTPTPEPEVSLEYKNALEKAESYSRNLHMSKQEIYEQLISEYGNSFPPDAAQYAVDTLFG